MIDKIKQYRNLIILIVAVAIATLLLACDPLGYFAQRAHDRAAVYNQIAVEKAETNKQIAIINAQTEAELKRIAFGYDTESLPTQHMATLDPETWSTEIPAADIRSTDIRSAEIQPTDENNPQLRSGGCERSCVFEPCIRGNSPDV